MERRRRVVLADDDESVRRLISRSLEALGGVELEAYASIIDALMAIRRSRFDLLIFDWTLPDLEAREAIRLARSQLKSSARVLVITGAAVSDEEKRLSQGLVDWWLPKPFADADLRRIVVSLA